MSIEGQHPQSHRYTIIPRTLCFLLKRDEVLLIRLPEDQSPWSGLYNGVGGHVEQGEDPLSAARREISEETGLSPNELRLCGVISIDTGDRPGIGLYVYVGQVIEGEIKASHEGILTWMSLNSLDNQLLVNDVPLLLPRAITSYRSKTPFSAVYTYDTNGELQIRFAQ